jgi:hypothetical protein
MFAEKSRSDLGGHSEDHQSIRNPATKKIKQGILQGL